MFLSIFFINQANSVCLTILPKNLKLPYMVRIVTGYVFWINRNHTTTKDINSISSSTSITIKTRSTFTKMNNQTNTKPPETNNYRNSKISRNNCNQDNASLVVVTLPFRAGSSAFCCPIESGTDGCSVCSPAG